MLFLITAILLVASEATAQIAVVVHENNPTSNLSMHELKLIYLGKATNFPKGAEIELLEFRSSSSEFYKLALNMSKREVRKHWLKKVFSGDHAEPPIKFDDIDEVRSRICKSKSSICFIDIEDVQECMKILSIDELKPDDEDYPLRSEPKDD